MRPRNEGGAEAPRGVWQRRRQGGVEVEKGEEEQEREEEKEVPGKHIKFELNFNHKKEETVHLPGSTPLLYM